MLEETPLIVTVARLRELCDAPVASQRSEQSTGGLLAAVLPGPRVKFLPKVVIILHVKQSSWDFYLCQIMKPV